MGEQNAAVMDRRNKMPLRWMEGGVLRGHTHYSAFIVDIRMFGLCAGIRTLFVAV